MKINKHEFKRKQPGGNNDYETAYNAILGIEPGESKNLLADNLKALRKYLYDLAAKSGKDIRTAKEGESELTVFCLRRK